MILNIPFYKQNDKLDCGPTALNMVLDYLGKKSFSREQLQDLLDRDRSGVTWTIGIAKTSAQLGFKTELYTSSLGFNPKNYELEFYQKFADEQSSSEQKIERLKMEAVKFGVHMEEKIFSLEELLSRINESCVPIILLDWGKIKGTDKFQGHFVPIVGYDENNVYVHNQDPINPQPNLAINRDLFEQARKSNGTDEDVVFMSRR